MLNTGFLSRSLKFCYVVGRGFLRDPPPIKTEGVKSVMNFPGGQHFTCVLIFSLYPLAVINHSCDYVLGPVNPPSESSNPGVVLGALTY